jgi:hypothetical protein
LSLEHDDKKHGTRAHRRLTVRQKQKTKTRRGKTDSENFLITLPGQKKNTLISITADAAPSRSRIFKGLLANASTVTDDKENVFAYAATDEKENDHY